jgi:hypothetical protein
MGGMKMEDYIPSAPEPSTDAEYEAAVHELLAEIGRVNERAARELVEAELPDDQSSAVQAAIDRLATWVDRCLDSLSTILLMLEHDRELARLQHDNLALRIENALLRLERRLPPGSPPDVTPSP